MARLKKRDSRRPYFGQASGKYSQKRLASRHNRRLYDCQHKGGSVIRITCRGDDSTERFHVAVGSKITKLKFTKVYMHNEIQPSTYRLIDLSLLNEFMGIVSAHVAICKPAQEVVQGKPPVVILPEKKTFGLATCIHAKCQGCSSTFPLHTSRKIALGNSDHHDVNVRAVWGSMSTGGGGSHLKELMATLNAPSLGDKSFCGIEEKIGNLWGNTLETDMLEAGKTEKRLAEERGDYFEGVAAITVICDGGWSKRTHKHSYNALGGVGVIIGAETKQILHVGVRNKYCYECSVAEAEKKIPKPHECFKNWSESSQAMESDIIVEGFRAAEKNHGVRYMRVIADGDSSVFAKIQEDVEIWGKHVTKLECANHVSKCYRSSLEKLVLTKPHYKGKGKLTEATRTRLATAVRCAIRMRSLLPNKEQAVTLLKKDILNSVHHVFNDHKLCSDFCKVKHPDNHDLPGPDVVPEVSEELDEADPIGNVFLENAALWSKGVSVSAENESRLGSDNQPTNLSKEMLHDVALLLNRVAEKASKLLGNFTTNLAESWMSLRAKFDGGKQVNRCASGSWHARCYGAGLRKNFGVGWSPVVWEKITGTCAGSEFTQVFQTRALKSESDKKRKGTPAAKRKRYLRKTKNAQKNRTVKAKQAYRPEAISVSSDVTPQELDILKTNFLMNEVFLSEPQLQHIEQNTIGQATSSLWHSERRKRLTSSNFKDIVVRRPTLPVQPLVNRLLYSSFHGTAATRFGLAEELSARQEYILRKEQEGYSVEVCDAGLKIDRNHPFLGSSADGVVYEGGVAVGLLEVKHVLYHKPLSFSEAAKSSSFCLNLVNDELQLKRSHSFYTQCQGQVNIYKLPWVDLVVRSLHPYQFHLERIYRDEALWASLVPKLKAFYHKALLPELASPRYGTFPGIREPGVWFEEQPARKKATKKPEVSPGTSAQQPSVRLSGRRSCKFKEQPTKRKVTTIPHCEGSSPEVSHGMSAQQPSAGCSGFTSVRLSGRRSRKVKFVGRRIEHKWTTEDGEDLWYKGSVVDVLRGEDGSTDAIYEVFYDEDEEMYEVENLHSDLQDGSLQFIDV